MVANGGTPSVKDWDSDFCDPVTKLGYICTGLSSSLSGRRTKFYGLTHSFRFKLGFS